MENNKIFISHASKDVHVVAVFVEHILRLGLDIPPERIFCSSMEGHGVKSGEYIPDTLKEEIHQSSVALLFISKNYKASEVCLNEMGAAWVTLDKLSVIPLLLPDIDFDEIGFLNINRLGLKIDVERDIYKFAEGIAHRLQLQSKYSIERLHKQVKTFLEQAEYQPEDTSTHGNGAYEEAYEERTKCFDQTLFPFRDILRKSLPTLGDGVHKVSSEAVRVKVLRELSETDFLNRIWYRFSEGDTYVEKMSQLSSGNWLISSYNLELDILNMWVSMNSAPQYEFILIQAGAQEPYTIDSDVGGEDFEVGVLPDGTIISHNEYLNGYAIINGETIDVDAKGVESRVRFREPHWMFFVSHYHKIGNNPREAIEFCKKLDNKDIDIKEETFTAFLRSLPGHPTVVTWN